MHVGVVEDVGVRVEVVEALRAQYHADVVASVEERDHLQEELLGGDLILFLVFPPPPVSLIEGREVPVAEFFSSLSLSRAPSLSTKLTHLVVVEDADELVAGNAPSSVPVELPHDVVDVAGFSCRMRMKKKAS